MRRFHLAGALIAMLTASAVQAAPLITVEQLGTGDQSEALAAKAAKLLSLGSYAILEDFEGSGTPTGGGTSLSTGVGTFGIPAGATSGTGAACIAPCDSFYVLDEDSSPFEGRFNTTEGGERWLDSNDITSVELTLAQPLHNLFFFITDVHDVNGALTLVASDGSMSSLAFPGSAAQNSGSLFFVSIASEDPIAFLRWNNTFSGDGWGVDDFGTLTSIPEPATLLLLGIGLAGAAGAARRRR